MKIWERLYRSQTGIVMSIIANWLANLQKPYMVYGYFDIPSHQFRKWTRMSSTVKILNKQNLSINDHVWVWHYSILDATHGLTIGRGSQIGAWVGIFTHGSENSIRLLGDHFVHIPNSIRKGYTRGSVSIGSYTFIGAGSVILPGVSIGKGCLIGAGTLITKSIPDYSVVVGSPGKIIGNTKDIDKKFLESDDYAELYYDQEAYDEIMRSTVEMRNETKK